MLNCTSIEYYTNNLLELSDNELQQVITAIEKEQNERKNKRKQELVNRAVTALLNLQSEYPDAHIELKFDNHDIMRFTLDNIAEQIKFDME